MSGPAGRGEVAERVGRHAERPGFRISEMRMSPTQRIPWHYHTNIQDTFYVLDGSVRITCVTPMNKSTSNRAKAGDQSARGARTWSRTAVAHAPPSSCSKELGTGTTCPLPERNPASEVGSSGPRTVRRLRSILGCGQTERD
jgi:hypothetical protein